MEKYLENRAEVPHTFEMRTMPAMGSMQMPSKDKNLIWDTAKLGGYRNGQENTIPMCSSHTKPGGPRWKDVVYRAVIDEDTGETLVDMESVEGVPEEECHQDFDGRPRNMQTILHYKRAGSRSGVSQSSEGKQWSLGSLDAKTTFLYAELNEEEDGIVIEQPHPCWSVWD